MINIDAMHVAQAADAFSASARRSNRSDSSAAWRSTLPGGGTSSRPHHRAPHDRLARRASTVRGNAYPSLVGVLPSAEKWLQALGRGERARPTDSTPDCPATIMAAQDLLTRRGIRRGGGLRLTAPGWSCQVCRRRPSIPRPLNPPLLLSALDSPMQSSRGRGRRGQIARSVPRRDRPH